jgi:hypothetical protein
MGLYPPGTTTAQLTNYEISNLRLGHGLPPMVVRSATKTNSDLGANALPEGFVSIPIKSHSNVALEDDLDLYGCEYVNTVDNARFPADSTYTSTWWLMDDLRAPISDMFNLTYTEEVEMNYMGLYNYCDVISSR